MHLETLATRSLRTVLFMLLTATGPMVKSKTKGNHEFLAAARDLVAKFEQDPARELLSEAHEALEEIDLGHEHATDRQVMRLETLHAWLHLLDVLDRSIDQNFDPNDRPRRFVPSPTFPGGIEPKGGVVDPASISDPKVRADYEKAIAANKARTTRYYLQYEVRTLAGIDSAIDPRYSVPVEAKGFIRHWYGASTADKTELIDAINTEISTSKRRADLLKLIKHGAAIER